MKKGRYQEQNQKPQQNQRQNQKPQQNHKQKQELQEPLKVELILPDVGTDLVGPTDYCCWVFPGRLLMGAYPKRTSLLSCILKAGITTFINLMHSKELERIETYGPYFETAKKLVSENIDEFPNRVDKLQYLHFPITDKEIAEDNKVIQLVQEIESRLMSNEKIFIHCRGGHGRTGTKQWYQRRVLFFFFFFFFFEFKVLLIVLGLCFNRLVNNKVVDV
eukprot:TRINITY_DN17981_c0_g1_i1.p2 TRINITY_DN17981_c0_g1~~TRINITY_DN17981_c0_g1_i1.p2  ORF type:complete len:219 (+),score=48.21 TRINITY_DN17981_c0_g1_i1:69-725(+)